MKDNQLFTELTAEFEVPAFTELDDEVAATWSGGRFYTNGNNPDVILYDDVNFGTRAALQINATNGDGDSNLDNSPLPGNSGWNNRTSSIVVIRGEWKIYRDSGFNGPSVTLKRGFYPNPQAFGFSNDTLTGILRVG